MAKAKRKTSIGYKLVMLILICIMAFSLYKIVTIVYEYYKGARAYDSVAELAGIDDLMPTSVDFDALAKINPDIRGWIYSKDTPINYPVVQGENNDKYLYQMFNEEWNGKGSIFVDYRCEEPFEQFNTVVYGHRMKDGSMFHSLTKYRDREYYEKHKKMQLFTPEGDYDIEIFGVVTLEADSQMYRMDFSDEEDEQQYIDWILENTETQMDVRPTAEDRLVMLSTCTYEFDDARLVVYGRLVEREE
ncbi:MAG: class B sortase [Emergencia sp.]|nr:class B sortase [Emergencia sp.]